MSRKSRGYWVEPRGKSGIYQLCWTEAGRKWTRSTGTTDEDEAEEYLARYLIALDTPDTPSSPTVANIVQSWLEQRSAISQRPTVSSLKHITRHMGWLIIEDLRPSHTTQYARRRTKEGAKPGTIIEELSKLSAALNWALGERIITWMPKINYPKAPKPKERWLTQKEVDQLLDNCKHHHIWLFVQIAIHSAARKGAILELTWDRVDFRSRRLDFGHKEGGKARTKPPINGTLLPILEDAKLASQSNYVIEYAGDRIVSIDTGFKRAATRAGMPDVSPHDLRRTAATWMAMQGVDMWDISQFLGHSSSAITEKVYAQYQPERLKKAAKALERS